MSSSSENAAVLKPQALLKGCSADQLLNVSPCCFAWGFVWPSALFNVLTNYG